MKQSVKRLSVTCKARDPQALTQWGLQLSGLENNDNVSDVKGGKSDDASIVDKES